MKQLPAVADSHAQPRGGTPSLLLAVVAPPTAVTICFLANVAFSRAGCQPAAAISRIALVLAAIAVSILGGIAARRRWSQLGNAAEYPAGAVTGRDRFFGIAGFAASGASLLLALYIGAVVLFLEPCWP